MAAGDYRLTREILGAIVLFGLGWLVALIRARLPAGACPNERRPATEVATLGREGCAPPCAKPRR